MGDRVIKDLVLQMVRSDIPVRTIFTDLLVSEGATEDFLQYGWLSKDFQRLIEAVDQTVKELQSIMLFSQVYWLTP